MSLTDHDFNYLADLVRNFTGIDLSPNKMYLFESRLLPIAQSEGLGSLEELVARLQVEPIHSSSLHQKIAEAMTTNETSFFRDAHPFEILKQTVIPEFLVKRKPERSLNIWCAACSTGQEPYSVAMLIQEHFPELMSWSLRILATDIAPTILARAKKGCYRQIEINRGLPVQLLAKNFEKNGNEWRIKECLRNMIETRLLNLIEPWPVIPAMDIIFIRNVLIYFDIETKKNILAKLRGLLRPDGYLFLGGAETTLNLDDAYERVKCDKTGYYRLK